jgi:kinetochore protein NDC80
MQTLANITGREYRNIFQYLYSMLDPGYSFEPQARFEDEFIHALKCIRYPFVAQVDPKWLAAPASMHSWPSLLGVLHSLTVLCKVRRGRIRLLQKRFLRFARADKITLYGERASNTTVF